MLPNVADLPSVLDRADRSPSVHWREDGPIEIRTARTPVERDAVYRFRHRVLGAAEGVRRGFVAARGRLLEPADVDAEILAAFTPTGSVQAAVRLETLPAALSRLDIPFDLHSVELGARGAFSSRLLIHPGVDGHVAMRLLASMIGLLSARGVVYDLCLLSEDSSSLRRRLGYRALGLAVGGGAGGGGVGGELFHLRLRRSEGPEVDRAPVPPPIRPWHRLTRRGRARP